MAPLSDLPPEDLPREKMRNRGVASLSDAELLAIFLRTGTPSRSAIEIGQDLLNKQQSLAQIGRMTLQELTREHGIGIAKACQLAACFELGSRVAQQSIKRIQFNAPQLVYDHLYPQMGHLRTESLRVILLDPKLRAIAIEEVSKGSVDSTVAHPREIIRVAVLHQCHCFILVHNHPSGDPTPSRADHRLTRLVKRAAELLEIQLADHIIIGQPAENRSAYFSFKESEDL